MRNFKILMLTLLVSIIPNFLAGKANLSTYSATVCSKNKQAIFLASTSSYDSTRWEFSMGTSPNNWSPISQLSYITAFNKDTVYINNNHDSAAFYIRCITFFSGAPVDTSQSANILLRQNPNKPHFFNSSISICNTKDTIDLSTKHSLIGNTSNSYFWDSKSVNKIFFSSTFDTANLIVISKSKNHICFSSDTTILSVKSNVSSLSNFKAFDYCEKDSLTITSSFSGSLSSINWQYFGFENGKTKIYPGTGIKLINDKTFRVYGNKINVDTIIVERRLNGHCNIDISQSLVVTKRAPRSEILAPDTITICEGNQYSFPGVLSGDFNSSRWQVQVNGIFRGIDSLTGNISYSITNDTLTITNFNSFLENSKIRLVAIANCGANSYSKQIVIQTLIKPRINSITKTIGVCENSDSRATISAYGSNIRYQWQVKKGTMWSNLRGYGYPINSSFDSDTLLLYQVRKLDSGLLFRCQVEAGCSVSITSDSISLIVDKPIQLSNMNSNTGVCLNSTYFNIFQKSGRIKSLKWEFSTDSIKWRDTSLIGILISGDTIKRLPSQAQFQYEFYKYTANSGYCGIITGTPNKLNLYNIPTAKISSDSNYCFGDTIQFYIKEKNSVQQIQWDSKINFINENDSCIKIYAININDYKYNLNSQYNCKSSGSILVNPKNLPQNNYKTNKLEICQGDSVYIELKAGIIATVITSEPSKIIGNRVYYSPLQTTIYQTNLQNQSGCNKIQENLVIVNKLPNVSVSNIKVVCEGSESEYLGTGAENYTWYENGKFKGVGSIYKTLGKGIITVTGNNSSGCSNSDTISIARRDTTIVSSLPTLEICKDTTSLLTISHNAKEIKWNPNFLVTQFGSKSYILSGELTRSYDIQFTSSEGCKTERKLQVKSTEPDDLKVNFFPREVCKGSTINLSVNNNGQEIYWYINDLFVSNSNTINYPFYYNSRIKVLQKNSYGCKSMDSGLIQVIPEPQIKFEGPKTVCMNTSGSLYKSESDPGVYKWEVTKGIINQTPFSKNIIVNWENISGTGKVKLTNTYNSQLGCKVSDSVIITITQNSSPNPTVIKPKNNKISSGILVADNPNYQHYKWTKALKDFTQQQTETTSLSWYDFGYLDTSVFVYYLDVWNEDDLCSSRCFYNSISSLTLKSHSEVGNSESTGLTKLYPNPSSGMVYLSTSSNTQYYVRVINTVGQTIFNGINSKELDLRSALPGLYNVQITYEDDIKENYKIVVAH